MITSPLRKAMLGELQKRRKELHRQLRARQELNRLSNLSGEFALYGIKAEYFKATAQVMLPFGEELLPRHYLIDADDYVWIKGGLVREQLDGLIYHSTLGMQIAYLASVILHSTEGKLISRKQTGDGVVTPPDQALTLPMLSYRRTRSGHRELLERFHHNWYWLLR